MMGCATSDLTFLSLQHTAVQHLPKKKDSNMACVQRDKGGLPHGNDIVAWF